MLPAMSKTEILHTAAVPRPGAATRVEPLSDLEDWRDDPQDDPQDLEDLEDLECLGDRIAELSAHIHAATYRLLVMIREFDRREGWAVGFRTCAHWLSWRTGIDLGAAREKVRVARALSELPLLSAGLRRGELSYSKARALTRVATPDNEEELVMFAKAGTAAHVERLVRAWRCVDRLEEQREERLRHGTRFLELRPDGGGMWRLRGRLDPEVGALLARALEAAEDALFRSAPADVDAESAAVAAADGADRPTATQRRADAIGLLAERALQAGSAREVDEGSEALTDAGGGVWSSRADRFQVVVHVEADDLTSAADPGGGQLGDGIRVSAETSRRIACDAGRVLMTEAGERGVLNVGRRTRTVPPALRRALERRDGCCRFPGCGVRFTDAHHVKHWADGGETRLENLVLLCRRHHRAVHEGDFKVRMSHLGGSGRPAASAAPRFFRSDGVALPEAPEVEPVLTDPTASFAAEHALADLGITAWTPTPTWQGERVDMGMALDAMRLSGDRSAPRS